MKIGILTFHWSSNFGAVLQTFCLQEFLKERGNEVEIINYIPRAGNYSWVGFLKRRRSFAEIIRYFGVKHRNSKLDIFRKTHLQLSPLFHSEKDLFTYTQTFDVLISGSDQVMNPNMVRYAENGKSCAYFLPFKGGMKKIGYAVSFGCEHYPSDLFGFISPKIQEFDAVLCREKSGQKILKDFGYSGLSEVVLDPVLLYGQRLLDNFSCKHEDSGKIISFFIRREVQVPGVDCIDDRSGHLYMEDWIATITGCRKLITNSYHASLIALLSHKSFAIVIEDSAEMAMKDRFETILRPLGLIGRIVNNIEDSLNLEDITDWGSIDREIDSLRIRSTSIFSSLI